MGRGSSHRRRSTIASSDASVCALAHASDPLGAMSSPPWPSSSSLANAAGAAAPAPEQKQQREQARTARVAAPHAWSATLERRRKSESGGGATDAACHVSASCARFIWWLRSCCSQMSSKVLAIIAMSMLTRRIVERTE